jgi:hypothetical protein
MRKTKLVAAKETQPNPLISAAIAAAPLIADPAAWINRRVETIELLSHEETRRRVSIDFTLSAEQKAELTTEHGAVIPISVMTKEARRNFDLRDESGAAVPVLGKEMNGELAHLAVMGEVFDAVEGSFDQDEFNLAWAELSEVVVAEPDKAVEMLNTFVGRAERGDHLPSAAWSRPSCRELLEALRHNYVLFAVVDPACQGRRILKYSSGEDFDDRLTGRRFERLAPLAMLDRVWRPGRREFQLRCPEAWRAKSFHVEVVIPEELRIETAFFYDFSRDRLLSAPDSNRNRASLYADCAVNADVEMDAYVVIASERRGATTQAAVTGAVVASLIWLGVVSGLEFNDPDASVSIVVAGAALYSGMTAARGESSLVSRVFSTPRFLLALISVCALGAAATLAMEFPSSRPTTVWLAGAIVSTAASICLLWSAIRAPS